MANLVKSSLDITKTMLACFQIKFYPL